MSTIVTPQMNIDEFRAAYPWFETQQAAIQAAGMGMTVDQQVELEYGKYWDGVQPVPPTREELDRAAYMRRVDAFAKRDLAHYLSPEFAAHAAGMGMTVEDAVIVDYDRRHAMLEGLKRALSGVRRLKVA